VVWKGLFSFPSLCKSQSLPLCHFGNVDNQHGFPVGSLAGVRCFLFPFFPPESKFLFCTSVKEIKRVGFPPLQRTHGTGASRAVSLALSPPVFSLFFPLPGNLSWFPFLPPRDGLQDFRGRRSFTGFVRACSPIFFFLFPPLLFSSSSVVFLSFSLSRRPQIVVFWTTATTAQTKNVFRSPSLFPPPPFSAPRPSFRKDIFFFFPIPTPSKIFFGVRGSEKRDVTSVFFLDFPPPSPLFFFFPLSILGIRKEIS